MCLYNLLETLGRVLDLSQDGIPQVVLEHVLRVLEGLLVALRCPVQALEAGFVVVRFGTENKGLDRYEDLKVNVKSN